MTRLNRASLVRALDSLAPVVAGAGKDARFSHVLMIAPPEGVDDTSVGLLAVSHDYALVGARYVDAESVEPGLRVMLPHGWLRDVAKELPGDVLTLDVPPGGRIVASAGRTRFTHDAFADELHIPAPLEGETERCRFTGKELSDALGEVAYALPPRDEWTLRPAMAAVLMEDDGIAPEVRFVATTGRQFAMHPMPHPDGMASGEPWQLSIHVQAVPVLRSFFAPSERVRVLYASKEDTAFAHFAGEWGDLRVRLVGEPYPQYRGVLGQSEGKSVTLSRADALAAATRATLSGGGTGVIRMQIQGGDFVVEEEGGGYRDTFPCDNGDGFFFRGVAAQVKAAVDRAPGERVRLVFIGGVVLRVEGDSPSVHATTRMG